MCFGYTDPNLLLKGELKVSDHSKDILENFKKCYHDPVRFVKINLKDGEISYKQKLRLAECTRQDYMDVIDKVVQSGQLMSVLHWFRLDGGELKYVRLSFDPKDDIVSVENTTKFFNTVEKYLTKDFAKITFMDMKGSTVQELSVDRLEEKFGLRYPGQ